ncbi:Gfo/Idh/MocA family oxidoreductase [Candidatus Poribacteria bacterium]|jgi:predicted dehydrogenase|nr:Gfo/Idh/MocA family oxidoreductase [Candidatus Poribacteria bacterium]MBT5533359.1 Gfo/Idh/MocA family oxidoreductase [Candidatus Poribacteria bacterium]MBT5715105.1 Gfo/Idh/MocA family oxidoreductase [Candidatus Poribacteria bacterium]MBT7809507.1 Gfo/Idh/MocA family oxidoreductase [Candidatus Poribacteria bacterium]
MLRVALIGCGGIAATHVHGYAALPPEDVRVTVVCDADRGSAEALARRAGATQVDEDWATTVARTDIDAVDVCLPHDLHAPVAIAAAEHGKHVIVEKPLATTLADADAMIAAAERSGVVLMCALCERYHPEYECIKEIVDSGVLGDPVLARIDHNQDVEMPPGHWIRQAERIGGGAIASAGCHRLDLLRWYFGEVAAVSSFGYRDPGRMAGEVAGVVNMRFESGAIGTLTINWMSRRRPWYESIWLEGTRGSVHNHGGVHVHSLDVPEWSEDYVRLDVPTADPFAAELRHFVRCIQTGSTPLTDGREARRTMAVALAAYESERSGHTVDPQHPLDSAAEDDA